MEDHKWKKQYIMFDLERKNQDIWYWENTISYPDHLMNLVHKMDLDSSSYDIIPAWLDWAASDDSTVVYGAVKNIRPEFLKDKPYDEKIYQSCLYIINSLSMAAEMSVDFYLKGHGLDTSKYKVDVSNIPIKRWDVGSVMGPHNDGGYEYPNLAFTIVTYLNDDYEGGEICFSEYDIKIKPKAGSSVMFPASFVHEVKPIISGFRYMSTNSINMI